MPQQQHPLPYGLAADLSNHGERGVRRRPRVDGLGVAERHRPHERLRALGVAGVEVADEPQVKQAHAVIGAQQVVVRLGFASHNPRAGHELEEEAEDDLAGAVALRLPSRLSSSNPSPSTYSETSTRRVVLDRLAARKAQLKLAA